MVKISVSIISFTLLLTGCGEQLASEARKAADQIAAEATKTASKKIDELKNNSIDQLKAMRGTAKEDADKAEPKPEQAKSGKTDW